MIKKLFIGVILTFSGCLNAMAITQETTIQKPEDFVKQFYQWYIEADKGAEPAEMNKNIYKFVEKSIVEKIQADTKHGTLQNDASYFTKVQDYDPEEWQSSINIHNAVVLNNDLDLVAVTFGKMQKTDIILFIKKENNHWQIIKAVDSHSYP